MTDLELICVTRPTVLKRMLGALSRMSCLRGDGRWDTQWRSSWTTLSGTYRESSSCLKQ